MDENNEIYRFRTSKALLEQYNELENQEIYLSDIENLNDPMEGFINYYWSGDLVLWNNLIRHYLICLTNMYHLALLCKEDEINNFSIPIFSTTFEFPTKEYEKIIINIVDKSLKSDGIRNYLEFITDRGKVYEFELRVHLKTIHHYLLSIIGNEFYNAGLIKKDEIIEMDETPIINLVQTLKIGAKQENFDEFYRILLESQDNIHKEIDFVRLCNNDNPKKKLILVEFSEEYIKNLKRIAYPEVYLACFMKECTNSAMWGYYGNNHKGVCLIFNQKNENDKCYFQLGKKKLLLNDIEYDNKRTEINFFTNIGRLPIFKLTEFWYKDHFNNISHKIQHLNGQDAIEEWRKKYTENLVNSYQRKFTEWKDEKETRIMIYDHFDSLKDKNKRKYKYDFSELKGIIFGYRTTIEDKKKILDIIEKKCKENKRKNFAIKQAEFDLKENKMKIRKLKNIKFSD